MKLEEFKSGSYKEQYQYKSFTPSGINLEWTWDNPQINTLLEDATKALSELNAFSFIVPNIDLFIAMHIAKEATKSSRIEGTHTNIDEVIMEEEQIDPEKRDDWREVQNYIKAMSNALGELDGLPLSNRLLKHTHQILMSGVRGEHKAPGEYRESQNWIGGTGLKDAVFIPPHHEEISELTADLEKFWHNESINVPQLIRIAISHYQFETIHPFLDGNGRVGRLLITLYLVNKSFLNKPCLYLSDYFERHKGAYYDALTTVRSSNDMVHWVKFFLVAVTETARNGVETFQKILSLKEKVEEKVMKMGRRAENGKKLLEILYGRPIIMGKDVPKLLEVSVTVANSMISDFDNANILREVTGLKRNRLYVFEDYLKLF